MHRIKLIRTDKKATTMGLKTIIEMGLWILAGLALIGIIVLVLTGNAKYVIDSALRGIKSLFQGL
jgi:hypothetical protein